MGASGEAKAGGGIDALKGAKAIAEFLYGDASDHKKVYYLAERGELPVFHLGATVCARREVLVSWIESQEKSGTTAARGKPAVAKAL